MMTRPYFMSDKNWYTTNEDGEFILTNKAPKEAVKDYNTYKQEYIKRITEKNLEEMLDIDEDNDWLIFPID